MQSRFLLLLTLGKIFMSIKVFRLSAYRIGCIQSIGAFQCYTCSSDTEAICNDPFTASSMADTQKTRPRPLWSVFRKGY